MATKEATKVETKQEPKSGAAKELSAADFIKIQELKPKQKFVNLDTGAEDTLEVKSNKYDLVTFDPKKHGTKEEFYKKALHFAAQLVHPIDEQVAAFLKYATSSSYQDGKESALQNGSYLTPEVKSRIGDILKSKTQFAELSKGECYDRWLAGYKEKKPAALSILKQAQDSEDIDL